MEYLLLPHRRSRLKLKMIQARKRTAPGEYGRTSTRRFVFRRFLDATYKNVPDKDELENR